MSDDFLQRATDALRREGDRESAVAAFTERRILATLEKERRARRKRVVWMLPIAAAFVASGAWATASGRTMRFVRAAVAMFQPEAVVTTAPPALPAPKAAPVVEPLPPPVESVEPAAAAEPVAAPKPHPAPMPVPLPRPIATSAPAASSETPAVAPSVDELYREAHRLHFAAKDYGAALAAWDRYLEVAPGGSLAPEARFNRAVCLARLGRVDEATRALTPFANGTYGPYRQDEARRLVEALRKR